MFSKKTLALALLIGLGVLTSNSFAIVIHNGASDADYISYGSQFDSVVWLGAKDGTDDVWRGSAVVIDSHWVLTAGHNLHHGAGASTEPIYDSFYIGTGDNAYTNQGTIFSASQYFIHESYSNIGYSPDIALLYFENPILEVTAASLFTGTDTLDSLVSIVGYGRPGTPATGIQEADRQRRACQGRLSDFGYSSIPDYQALSTFYPITSSRGLSLGGIGAPGDSGGGWFYEDGSLMGISGFQIGSPNYLGDTGAIRVSEYADWIYETQASVNRTRSLDLRDFAAFSASWLSIKGETSFNGAWDLVEDDVIDALDLAFFAENWLLEDTASEMKMLQAFPQFDPNSIQIEVEDEGFVVQEPSSNKEGAI